MEILAGDGFETAVREFNLDAKKTFGNSRFEVWDISQESLDALNSVPDEEWKEDYGWYRFSGGCNISHYPLKHFSVNGNSMYGFLGSYDPFHRKSYARLTEYLRSMLGVSTEKNICAVCVDLAKLNNMTMAELFEKFEGYECKYE